MSAASTPMFEQYLGLKARYPGCILFYRMGDFYETFFDDAVVAARDLELTLTTRNKHDPDPIPMAGVPHHQAAVYVQRLLDAGHRVAIADQMEDPAVAKGLVRREVTRVVTPGMVLDPTSLQSATHNWLAAVCRDRPDRFGVAFLDASTGHLRCTTVLGAAAAVSEIERHEPKEILIEPGLADEQLYEAVRGVLQSETLGEAWRAAEATREIRDVTGAASPHAFGLTEGEPALRAAGAVLRYARELLHGGLRNVHAIQRYQTEGHLVIDETTRRNLELVRSLLGGQRKGSLLGLIDRCATAMGSRMLRDWILAPLLDPGAIRARFAAVRELVDDTEVRPALRHALRGVADVERLVARVAQGTAHARDLAGLRRSLAAAPDVAALAARLPALAPHGPADPCADVHADLATWLVDEPPLTLGEGGVIRPGADPELDALNAIAMEGNRVIEALEAREQAASGIGSLKVRRNSVFGFYIEISRANLHKVPERYIRRQTLSNAERFITPELKELEDKVLGADERRRVLEIELFRKLRERVADASARLQALARSLAALDVLASYAELAAAERWVEPEVDTSLALDIVGGRHPVVEAMLVDERFVPNDVALDPDGRRLVILTGPNMAGKSTVLRQVALIVVLAQAGSFVPAERVKLGLVDRVFTRVGAADDLARGRSTFMVEMAETAAILHSATRRSLVVLDEIGRGTSTYDGLAIAWAVAEDLADRIQCRALFATHYHELCGLAESRPHVANQSVAVAETGDRIVFLRRLKEGGASRSYGIQCARIAGLPQHVVNRAGRLLTRFEKGGARNEAGQLSLFGGAAPPEVEEAPPAPPPMDAVRAAVRAIDPDALTPRSALEALYQLATLARES